MELVLVPQIKQAIYEITFSASVLSEEVDVEVLIFLLVWVILHFGLNGIILTISLSYKIYLYIFLILS